MLSVKNIELSYVCIFMYMCMYVCMLCVQLYEWEFYQISVATATESDDMGDNKLAHL